MNAKTVRISNILAAAMLLINTGCIILNLLLKVLFSNAGASLPAGVCMCLALFLPSVVLLINGIVQAKRKQGGIFDVIVSVVTILVSAVWTIAYLLNWAILVVRNVIIEFYYRMEISMPLGQLLTILSYVSIAYMLLTTLVALYLLIVYVISVLRSKQKWLQIKAELHKPVLAVAILLPNLLSVVLMILNRILLNSVNTGVLELNTYSTYVTVTNAVTIIAEVLLLLAGAILLLTFGLILKKKPAEHAEPTVEQDLLEQDMDLPAGVSREA